MFHPIRTLVLLLLVALPTALVAGASPRDMRPVEAVTLMDVTGRVTIAADGAVQAVTFDSKVPPELLGALQAKARAWRFRPVMVGGKAVLAETAFVLSLSAVRAGDGYRVLVDGSHFGDVADKSALVPDGVPAPVRGGKLTPPEYPNDMMARGRTGRVLLAILVSGDGHTENVSAVQSLAFDFKHRQSEADARKAMQVFERFAIGAARRWTFTVPPGFAARPPASRTVMVPVEFQMLYDTSVAGQWLPVQRGPRQEIDWMPPERRLVNVAIGASGTAMTPMDSPYQLLNPANDTPVM